MSRDDVIPYTGDASVLAHALRIALTEYRQRDAAEESAFKCATCRHINRDDPTDVRHLADAHRLVASWHSDNLDYRAMKARFIWRLYFEQRHKGRIDALPAATVNFEILIFGQTVGPDFPSNLREFVERKTGVLT